MKFQRAVNKTPSNTNVHLLSAPQQRGRELKLHMEELMFKRRKTVLTHVEHCLAGINRNVPKKK